MAHRPGAPARETARAAMSTDPRRLAHARLMCRGFGSVPVAVAGSATAPDGLPRRGLLRVPESVVDELTGTIVERAATLRLPTVDAAAVTRGALLLVDGVSWQVRDALPTSDGAITVAVLARAD
jgi:hypothetical protein